MPDWRFVDLEERADPVDLQAVSLGMDGARGVRRARAERPKRVPTWIEPAWKMLWSNKGLLAILWELFPGHSNLLPALSHTIRTA